MPTTSPRASTSGPPELPGLMAASVWMNSPGLLRFGGVRIRPIHRAHDSARYREAKSVGIAEGQHSLTGPDFLRVAPGSAGQIRGAHLQDSKVGQRIGANQFRFHYAAIAGGHADVDRSIDHVVVGDDVSVRRDHHAAAHAVLDFGVGRCMCGPKNCPNGPCWPKNCCMSSRQLLARHFWFRCARLR